jgi:hypothetical protein
MPANPGWIAFGANAKNRENISKNREFLSDNREMAYAEPPIAAVPVTQLGELYNAGPCKDAAGQHIGCLQ